MKAEVYSKATCPWCVKAKHLLQKNNVEFSEVIVDSPAVKAEIERKSGKEVRTVPQIFIDGNHVGGYTDLEAYFKNRTE